jgi:hypothetical protein
MLSPAEHVALCDRLELFADIERIGDELVRIERHGVPLAEEWARWRSVRARVIAELALLCDETATRH